MSFSNDMNYQAKTNTMAIMSLVAGGLSVLVSLIGICIFWLGFLSLILGVVAVILASRAKKKIAASGGTEGGAGLATAGLITGIIGGVGGLILAALVIFTVILAGVVGFSLDSLMNY